MNKHDVVIGIKNDWKIIEVESFRVLEKECLGILVSVNLGVRDTRGCLNLANQLLGRTCGIEEAPLNHRLEHQLSRSAGVASEGGDPRGHEGLAGVGGRGRNGVWKDDPVAKNGFGACAGVGARGPNRMYAAEAISCDFGGTAGGR